MLTKEEVGGGLRRLRPTAMLALERYKSLQRRGVLEPRKPALKRVGRKVSFIHVSGHECPPWGGPP